MACFTCNELLFIQHWRCASNASDDLSESNWSTSYMHTNIYLCINTHVHTHTHTHTNRTKKIIVCHTSVFSLCNFFPIFFEECQCLLWQSPRSGSPFNLQILQVIFHLKCNRWRHSLHKKKHKQTKTQPTKQKQQKTKTKHLKKPQTN